MILLLYLGMTGLEKTYSFIKLSSYLVVVIKKIVVHVQQLLQISTKHSIIQ